MTAPGLSATALEQCVGEALARADWTAALGLLHAAREQRGLSLPELDMLARAAYGGGEFELAITAWEQAYAGCQLVGDDPGAATAAVTVSMYLMMDTGLMAPVRGWLGRAERLLEDGAESPAHALAAMVHTYERFLCGDTDSARRWAQLAIDRGTRQRVGVATALGRVATARLMILDGDVERGLELLDEAAVAATAPGDPNRAMCLANLGGARLTRYRHLGALADLTRAVEATGAAVASMPADDPLHAVCLHGLGITLRSRFERTEVLTDLSRAIEADEAAVAATRPEHPLYAPFQLALGTALISRFQHHVRMSVLTNPDTSIEADAATRADLEGAIEAYQAALTATPPDHHLMRAEIQNNLTAALTARGAHLGDVADLDQAIAAGEAAVAATPPEHPNRAWR